MRIFGARTPYSSNLLRLWPQILLSQVRSASGKHKKSCKRVWIPILTLGFKRIVPCPVTVTTRIIMIFSMRIPKKTSFPHVTGRGDNPKIFNTNDGSGKFRRHSPSVGIPPDGGFLERESTPEKSQSFLLFESCFCFWIILNMGLLGVLDLE